jgi:hypothetical protein
MRYDLPPGVFQALDAARRTKIPRDESYRNSMEFREEMIGLLDSPAAGGMEGKVRSRSENKALREFLLSTIAPPDVISVLREAFPIRST